MVVVVVSGGNAVVVAVTVVVEVMVSGRGVVVATVVDAVEVEVVATEVDVALADVGGPKAAMSVSPQETVNVPSTTKATSTRRNRKPIMPPETTGSRRMMTSFVSHPLVPPAGVLERQEIANRLSTCSEGANGRPHITAPPGAVPNRLAHVRLLVQVVGRFEHSTSPRLPVYLHISSGGRWSAVE